MRCPDCNKFTGLETQDPEVDSLEVSESGNDGNFTINGNVRLVRNCADCGQEMKEANFDIDHEVEIEGWVQGDEYSDLDISEDSSESTESGGGRYKKNMIGFTLDYTITGRRTRKGKTTEFKQSGQLEDAEQASAFDELI